MKIQNKNLHKYSSLLGGFIFYLLIGSYYLWGNIQIYVISYFRIKSNPNLTIHETSIIFPFTMLLITIGMPFGVKIAKNIGFKRSMLIEGLVLSLTVFLSSFSSSFSIFVLLYGIIFGLMCGLIQMQPLYLAGKNFPSRKGKSNSIINSGFGFSSIISNNLAFAFQNIKNIAPSEMNQQGEYFYSNSTAYIAMRTPTTLKLISLYQLGLVLLGTYFIMPNIKLINDEKYQNQNNSKGDQLQLTFIQKQSLQNSQEQLELDNELAQLKNIPKLQHFQKIKHEIKFLIRNKNFIICFVMAFFSYSYGAYIASNYKNIGIKKIQNDLFLTQVGTISAFSNGFSCLILWGILIDKFHFYKTYFLLISLEIFISLTLYYSLNNQVWFAVNVALQVACEAGHFVLYPTLLFKLFGAKLGSFAFGFLHFSFSLSNITQYLLNLIWESQHELFSLQLIFTIFCLISLVMLIKCSNSLFKQ